MTPARRSPDEDRVSYIARICLYAVCIVAPGVGLLAGKVDAQDTLAAALALLGAVGPAVALSRARTEKHVERNAYESGLVTGLEADEKPHGRHRLPEGEDT